MKRINIENIDLLTSKFQPGSNSEFFEFSIDVMSTADYKYSFSFNYSSNVNGEKYSGYFQLFRQIENYIDERGRDTDVCRLVTTLWHNENPSANIEKDTVIPLTVIKSYELLYLFIRNYIREVIG